MFKMREGARIDKVPSGDSSQLNLYREFENIDPDTVASLYTPEAIQEDKEREEEMINETLTRSEWEEKLREAKELKLAEEVGKIRRDIKTRREVKKPTAVEKEMEDSELDKPGYELYGRFAQYIGKSRKKMKK